jgi:hypothetical protein
VNFVSRRESFRELGVLLWCELKVWS